MDAKLAYQIRIISIKFRTFLQTTDLIFQTLRVKLEQNLSRVCHGRRKTPRKKPVDSKRHGEEYKLRNIVSKNAELLEVKHFKHSAKWY